MNPLYDLVIIGGGPAGYVAAIRAGQLGKRVACIEMDRPGGTCLDWGCIPLKNLSRIAELYASMHGAERLGLKCSNLSHDFSKIMDHSRQVAGTMCRGIEYLFKKNKVDHFVAKGEMISPTQVRIHGGERNGEVLEAKNILLATGCRPRKLEGIDFDAKKIISSREALVLKEQPKSLLVMGSGAIGVEFSYFFNALGTKVRMMEMLPRISPMEDHEISAGLEGSLKKQGIAIHTSTRVEGVERTPNGVRLRACTEGKDPQVFEADVLLVAIGVQPFLEGALGPGLSVKLDANGFIAVDERYQTSIPGVYAAGDIMGGPWLAHVASYRALQVINGLYDIAEPKPLALYPVATYCQPQVGSVGMTETKVKEKGIPYRVGRFPFAASGKAVACEHPEGFVKVIVSEPDGEILGAHILGNSAADLIAEYALAMNHEITAEDIHHTIHAHPTLSEALAEAAADSFGEAIHV